MCRSLDEADRALALCFEEQAFGDSGLTVVVEEFLDPGPRRRVEKLRVVGVHPSRGEDTGDRIGQLERPRGGRGVHADADQSVHAGLPGGLDHE